MFQLDVREACQLAHQCAGHIMTKHVGALNLTEQPQCRIKAVQCNTADHYAVTLNEVFTMRSKTPAHKMNPHYIELHPWWSMPVCILLYSSSIDPQCMALQLTPLHSGKLWQKSTFSKAVLEVCFLCRPLLQCTTSFKLNSAQWQTFAEEHFLKISVGGTRMLNIQLEFSAMPLKCKSTLRTGQCYNLLYCSVMQILS